jgi:hypothetical protein
MMDTSTIGTGNEESRFDSSYGDPRSATNSSGGWNPNGTGYNDVTANYSPVFNNQSADTFERGEIIDPNKSEGNQLHDNPSPPLQYWESLDSMYTNHLLVTDQTEAQGLAHDPKLSPNELRRDSITHILSPPERDDDTQPPPFGIYDNPLFLEP